jgi:hypothetical protein
MVCPIRDPQKTWVTWQSRKRDQDFTEKWQLLNTIFETQDVSFIPIDTEDRDSHLRKLEERLNIPLRTDWTPVNSQRNIKVDPIDLSGIYRLPVVSEFYEQR